MELTELQRQWVIEYIRSNKNLPTACLAVGVAVETGKNWLKLPAIKREIAIYSKPVVIDPPEYWKARKRFS